MIIDFQHHYTPIELFSGRTNVVTARLDENGNPNYRLEPLLTQLPAHIVMMDLVGIDAAVLSSGPGFDQPDVAKCRLINDRVHEATVTYPGRFIGLAHVPALNPAEMIVELKRCRNGLDFPGVVIASELQGLALDAPELRPFWRTVAELDMYAFIHPLPNVIAWKHMDGDDLGRMLGWEFSLMVAAVRMINSGLLDELPGLRVQFAHFAGGLGRYLGRIKGFQQREEWGTAAVPRHNRNPAKPFGHYINAQLYYDCAGWVGPSNSAEFGAHWVRAGMEEVAFSQVVFATDYPQAVRDDAEVAAYVKAVGNLSPNARAMMHGANAAKLIPDIASRIARRAQGDRLLVSASS